MVTYWFIHNEIQWIIEYDGEQHFKEIPFFCKTGPSFEQCRQIDIIKTFVACTTGVNLIRIDYSNITDKDIRYHILRALELDNVIYYSNHEIYNWLINGIVQNQILYKESPSLWNKYYNVILDYKSDMPNPQNLGLTLNIIK